VRSRTSSDKQEQAPDKAGKRGLTVPAAIVAVGVVAASFLLQGGGAPPVDTNAAAEAHPPAPDGPVVETEPVVLSLADGSYLKVGVAFQLAGEEGGKKDKEEGSDELSTARALDIIVSTYSGYTGTELVRPRGRAAAKKEITERVVAAYGGEVTGLYLTTFVVQ